MVLKDRILELIGKLINSALTRGTEQGTIIFRKSIEFIEGASSESEVLSILSKLNRALIGIESHGHLTEEESTWVRELREMERVAIHKKDSSPERMPGTSRD